MPASRARWKFTPSGRRRPGRPAGATLFHRDKKRFELVLATVLIAMFKLPEPRADDLAILLLSGRPIALSAGDVGRAKLSCEKAGLEDRREWLARSARMLFAGRSPTQEEIGWLIHSFVYLCKLAEHVVTGREYRGFVDQLAALGWKPALSSIAKQLQALPDFHS